MRNQFSGIKLLIQLPFLCFRWIRNRSYGKFVFLTISIFVIIEYSFMKLLFVEHVSSARRTRLYPDLPITLDLRSFEICPSESLKVDEIVRSFHRQYENANDQICFLIEHLDGGPWWSYVSQEFAEILVQLKEFGEKSNITYRSLPYPNDELNPRTNLRQYFLRACDIDENILKDEQPFIIVLFWDINVLPWYYMRDEWNELLLTTRIQISIFVDDLHFSDQSTFLHHQFFFQHLATEIFTTYPYVFHNYHHDIPTNRLTWLAHSASKYSAKSVNQSAENLLFVSGANLFDWYPCRSRAFTLCQKNPDLVACLRHPGYGINMKNDSSFYFGAERYFSYMRRNVFGLATCESVHYAIAKLFEIPGNGLVLVTTDESVDVLQRLGFDVNEDFLVVNCSSSKYLIENIKEFQEMPKNVIERIRRQGQEKVHRRHLTIHRSELLHVRLLSQALLVSTNDAKEKRKWRQWGKKCRNETLTRRKIWKSTKKKH